MAMGDVIGRLSVVLGLDTAAFETNAKRAAKTTNDTGDRMETLGRRVGGAAKALVGLGVAMAGSQLVGQIKDMALAGLEAGKQIDQLSKLSNASTGEFQRAAYAAKSVGIETEKLADIYKDVNDKIGDFLSTGGGEMADFFEKVAPKVGVTAEMFRGLSGPAALQLYVSSLQKANLGQAEMTFYMEAIADDATRLLPLLKDNGAEFARLAAAADTAGIVLSEEEIQKSVEALGKYNAMLEMVRLKQAKIAAENADGIIAGLEAMEELKASALSAFGELATGLKGIDVPPLLRNAPGHFDKLIERAVAAGQIAPQEASKIAAGLEQIAKTGKIDLGTIVALEGLVGVLEKAGKISPEELKSLSKSLADLKTAADKPPEISGWQRFGKGLSDLQKQIDEWDAKIPDPWELVADGWNKNVASWKADLAEGAARIDAFGKLTVAMKDRAVAAMQALYQGVKTWVWDNLNAIWDGAKKKIEETKKAFWGLYDAVVGHSYIPDMVDGIGEHMLRLDEKMVKPAKTAAEQTKQIFEKLQQDVRGLMDELFPEDAEWAQFQKDLKVFDQAIAAGDATGFNVDQLRAGRSRLIAGASDDTRSRSAIPLADQLAMIEQIGIVPITALKDAMAGLPEAVNDNAAEIGVANVKIAQSFKDMADQSLNALKGLADAIQGGGFLDILGAVIGLGLQLGSIGAFGKGFQTKVNSVPKFASGTSFAPGGLSLVGERGPELVNLPRGAQVIPNHALKGAGGGNVYHIQGNLLTDEFWQRIQSGDVAAARAGANGGVRQMAMRQSRRVA